MKKGITLLFILLIAVSCNNYSVEYQQVQKELAQARDSIKILKTTIEALAYPANQRLVNIQSQIKNGDFDKAESELSQLVSLFPNSTEAQMKQSISAKIESGRLAMIEKEKRLKALGFKALKDHSTIIVGSTKAVISSINIGNTFIFDNYGSEYRYLQADKNNKYVTGAMSITSEESNPKLPQCAIYIVNGDKLIYKTSMKTRFARWDDYGSYLGNDADFNNDFAKVNTVRFKIGEQISIDESKQPFVIVMKKENALERYHESFSHPEYRYVGAADFKQFLSIEDFQDGGLYVAVKRYNFDKL